MKQYKVIFILLITLCLLHPSFLFSQWLETTIYVPDSLYGVSGPQAFTYNSTNNKIYVGGEQGNRVIVIDGVTNEKIAKIPAGFNISALCWNPINNKVYCANTDSNNVTIIDSATNSVITTIAVGDDPWAHTWNDAQNRTYVANYRNSSISVIQDSMTGVEENDLNNVVCLKLYIYPNPFCNRTDIRWLIPGGIDSKQKSVVSIKIYDVGGRLVRQWDYPTMKLFDHISWDGVDNKGQKLPSSVYFLKLQAGDNKETKNSFF